MEYEHDCCRCGFCCLMETCPAGMMFYGVRKLDLCPGLSFDGNVAVCALVPLGLVPVGDGCCISARVFRAGMEFQFDALPKQFKYIAAEQVRRQRMGGVVDDKG